MTLTTISVEMEDKQTFNSKKLQHQAKTGVKLSDAEYFRKIMEGEDG